MTDRPVTFQGPSPEQLEAISGAPRPLPPTTVVVGKVGKGVYGFACDGCLGFVFERTRIAAAREWADEHNRKHHLRTISIVHPGEEGV